MSWGSVVILDTELGVEIFELGIVERLLSDRC